MSDRETLLRSVAAYYAARVRRYGATAAGVDWNSTASQELRFAQLARLWESSPPTVEKRECLDVIDFGCGYGALFDYLTRTHPVESLRYQGLDIAPEMLELARAIPRPSATFTSDSAAIMPADYVVASGVFNVRLSHEREDWEAFIRDTFVWMDAHARRGFAVNFLSTYSNDGKRRPDLYYADPCRWLDYCARRHTVRVALLHDYPLYEFTLIARR